MSLSVCEGEIVTLIGSNGAGKTTLLRAVSNLKAHHAGQIIFDGRPTEKLSPQDTVKAGIGHVPQGRALFPYLPVIDNLRLGAFLRRDKRAVERDLDMIFSHFPILKERRRQLAGTLSGRRTADAGHRPVLDGPPQTAYARRTLPGPGPDPGAGDRPGDRGKSTAPGPASCWSSKTPAWP